MKPLPQTIRWNEAGGGSLEILDQTALPSRIEVRALRTLDEVIDAIRRLAVRGAPAIGVAAAYGVALAAGAIDPTDASRWLAEVDAAGAALIDARPTAVNLAAAVTRVLRTAHLDPRPQALLDCAATIHAEDREACRALGRHGADLIRDGSRVLTHCNTGRLATAGDGTALALLFEAQRRGVRFSVLADETRPLLQGARLTALELQAAGIPTTLIVDSAAAFLMARGEVDLVIVGADRIAANGDVANKIGTYSVALAAAAHHIPFWVVAPFTTFDPDLERGDDIPIEERAAEEVSHLLGRPLAAADVGVRNPAFDVTPARLVTGIVTDRGRIQPVDRDAIKALSAGGRSNPHDHGRETAEERAEDQPRARHRRAHREIDRTRVGRESLED